MVVLAEESGKSGQNWRMMKFLHCVQSNMEDYSLLKLFVLSFDYSFYDIYNTVKRHNQRQTH